MDASILVGGIDAAAREATLFAAIWFLVGGLDDLAIDMIYVVRRLRLWFRPVVGTPSPEDAPPPGRIAVFIPAWDESAVIGRMLRAALTRFDHQDYILYVGTYPNDPATISAVAEVAATDARVRLVVGSQPGPSTKAGCLNTLWRAMLRDEAAEGTPVTAVALHDAEDVVQPRPGRSVQDRIRPLPQAARGHGA